MPFIDVPFPVTNDGILVDIIREEVLRTAIDKCELSDNFVEDIKSAKTPSGMDASRLLLLPVSTFFEVVASDAIKKLTVVVKKPTPPPEIKLPWPYHHT